MTELMFFLDSPYKWGKGWTTSFEELKEMNENSFHILKLLGHKTIENDYDVPEGEINDVESSYMHNMEFHFRFLNGDQKRIDEVIKIVKSNTLSMFKITEIKTIKEGIYKTL